MGHPSKFQRVSRLGIDTAAKSVNRSQPNFARCLAASWVGTQCRPIHFWWLLPRNGILPGAKFTLCPSLALSYIGRVTARHSSSERQTNISALSRGRHHNSARRPSRWALAHILVRPNSYTPALTLRSQDKQIRLHRFRDIAGFVSQIQLLCI